MFKSLLSARRNGDILVDAFSSNELDEVAYYCFGSNSMTPHRLQLFVSIAKHLSITKASRELRISQPSVSYQLKLLQEQIGGILFLKAGRGIELTDKGQTVLKEAESILSQIDTLNRKYRVGFSPGILGSLTLGGSYGPSASLLPSVMAAFSRQNPSVELSLRTGSSPEIQDLVVRSEVEFAIVTNPPSCASLAIEPLREEKLSIFVAPGYPLAKKNRLDLTELSKLPLIIREGKKGSTRIDELIARLCNQNCKLKVRMRCDSPDSVKVAVTKGAGVGILYHDLVKEDVRRGDFKLVKIRGIDLSGASSNIYSRGKPLSSSAEGFLVLLRNARTVVRSNKT